MNFPTPPAPLLTLHGEAAITDWALDSASTHLNHGSFGAVPRFGVEYQRELARSMDANPCRWFMGQVEMVEANRVPIAKYLGVSAADLAMVSNASAGMSVIYNSLTFTDGAEIVVTDHAYGAVLEGARRVALEHKGQLRIAKIPLAATAEQVVGLVMEQVSAHTALIVIDQVTSATARAFPVEEITHAAAALNIPVAIDGAHAPGVLAQAVPDVDAIWVGNLHKFSCTPRGTAVVVARGKYAKMLRPLIDSWGFPFSFPNSFDHVGTQDVTPWLSAPTVLQGLEDRYGWAQIREYTAKLASYGQCVIQQAINVKMGTDHKVDVGMEVGPLKLVRLPEGLLTGDRSPHQIRALISAKFGFETAITSFENIAYLRLSAHVYNTHHDYEAFAKKVVPELCRLARDES